MSDLSLMDTAEETLGIVLQQRRIAMSLSRSEVAAAAHVQEKYLRAFEEGDNAQLPDALYQQFFLRAIAGVLGLTVEDVLRLHGRVLEQEGIAPTRALPPPRASRRAFLVAPRLFSAAVGAGFAALVLALLGWEIHRMTAVPTLVLSGPTDGALSAVPTVSVSGATEREAEVRINGEPVYLLPDGTFTELVNLHRGLNIIKIAAKKVHSDEQIAYRRVLWNGSAALGDGGNAQRVP